MKKLFLMLLLSFNLCADTAIFTDPERLGEGLVLTEYGENQIAFILFTHQQNAGSPPIVSPAPPPPLFCDRFNVWFIGLGAMVDEDTATGTVYYNAEVPTFPVAENGFVADEYEVGTFTAVREEEGFALTMDSNYIMCNLSVFNTVLHMRKKVIE